MVWFRMQETVSATISSSLRTIIHALHFRTCLPMLVLDPSFNTIFWHHLPNGSGFHLFLPFT